MFCPVSVYCDRVGCHVLCLHTVTGWGISCPVSAYCDRVEYHVLCLRQDIPVLQNIGQSTTATSKHRRDMTSDALMTLNPNKQTTHQYTSY